MSSDLSGEITAVATVVLAVFAVVTAVFAILAFRKQSQEVRAIEQQVSDQEALTRQQAELLTIQSVQLELQRQQLDDQRAEQRRAQAIRILISAEPRPEPEISVQKPIRQTFVTVTNTSLQPIYDLRFLFREEDGKWTRLDDPPENALVLPPSEEYQYPFDINLPYLNFVMDPSLIAAGVVFRDANGVHWRLYSDGRFDEEPAT